MEQNVCVCELGPGPGPQQPQRRGVGCGPCAGVLVSSEMSEAH